MHVENVAIVLGKNGYIKLMGNYVHDVFGQSVQVHGYTSGEEFLHEHGNDGPFDLITIGQELGDILSGIEVVRKLRDDNDWTPVCMVGKKDYFSDDEIQRLGVKSVVDPDKTSEYVDCLVDLKHK
jgi:hypothetical protein